MIPVNRFRDRIEAGQALARHLVESYHRERAIVLALPRGGVPIGREIAQTMRIVTRPQFESARIGKKGQVLPERRHGWASQP